MKIWGGQNLWPRVALQIAAEVLTGCFLFFLSLAVCSLFGWACGCLKFQYVRCIMYCKYTDLATINPFNSGMIVQL